MPPRTRTTDTPAPQPEAIAAPQTVEATEPTPPTGVCEFTGTYELVYADVPITVQPGAIVDFGKAQAPNDGRWQSAPDKAVTHHPDNAQPVAPAETEEQQ